MVSKKVVGKYWTKKVALLLSASVLAIECDKTVM